MDRLSLAGSRDAQSSTLEAGADDLLDFALDAGRVTETGALAARAIDANATLRPMFLRRNRRAPQKSLRYSRRTSSHRRTCHDGGRNIRHVESSRSARLTPLHTSAIHSRRRRSWVVAASSRSWTARRTRKDRKPPQKGPCHHHSRDREPRAKRVVSSSPHLPLPRLRTPCSGTDLEGNPAAVSRRARQPFVWRSSWRA
jgi:hypothetical protein